MVRIKEVKSCVARCHAANVPVFLWGPPGIGKSAVVKQYAEEKGIRVVDLRMSLLNPVDLRGIPCPDKESGQTRWLPPVFLPKDGEGILFLDELNSAPPSVQAAAYQLILDRQVGEYRLPKGWYIVAAGNRMADRALVYEMPSALRNRLVHIDVETSIDDWAEWAWQNDIDSRVISFIRFKNSMLFKFDGKSREFPSPRTWEFVSRILKAERGSTDQVLIAGAVGEAAAHEFVAFLNTAEALPLAEDALAGKEIKLPSDPSVIYAFCGSLVMKVAQTTATKQLEMARRMINVCTSYLPAEFAVMVITDYSNTKGYKKLSQQIVRTDEFKRFTEKFGNVILGA